MGIGGIGPMELVIVLVIALVILGPKRLPEVGKSIGNGMREFKDAISGHNKDDDEDEEDFEPHVRPEQPADPPDRDGFAGDLDAARRSS